MREFFRGWRRKAGVVTLLMALAMMASWWRSYRLYEEIGYDVDGTAMVWFNHRRGCLSVALTETEYPIYCRRRSDSYAEWDNYPVWPWHDPVLTYPHWLFVLPLTLLSACLILWKPRK